MKQMVNNKNLIASFGEISDCCKMLIRYSEKTLINVITTGGTIEKSYDEFDGSLENRSSFIKKRLISKLRIPYTELNFHPVLAKDSLHMTEDDRKLLLSFIKTLISLGNPLIVLHGTDTMEVTAQYCYDHLSGIKVPVIFTGAMRPLGFEDSDALQNVTEALHVAKILDPGVYISFHGSVFQLPGVRKNKALGTFESIKKNEP